MSDIFHEEIPNETFARFSGHRGGAAAHFSGPHQTGRTDGGLFRRLWYRRRPTHGWEQPLRIGNSAFPLDWLRRVPARIRFLSAEPLLEDSEAVNLEGIHWVIVGGESGPKARPMNRNGCSISNASARNNTPPFSSNSGADGAPTAGNGRRSGTGRLLEGRTWDGVPEVGASRPQKD